MELKLDSELFGAKIRFIAKIKGARFGAAQSKLYKKIRR